MRALIAREREAALASQFDTALNNMPHGLSMFRADRRLAVMNHRFSEMMNLSDDFVQQGAEVSDICSACVVAGSISASSARLILREVENSQASEIITTDPDINKNRSLSWTFQPMVGGGTVVLVEDITERKDAEARISHLARYDELTELPNRVNFRDEIGRLLAIQQGAVLRRCCSSTPTSSSRSMTRWVILRRRRWSPTACVRCCGRRTSWRGSAATNSSCSSRTSIRTGRGPAGAHRRPLKRALQDRQSSGRDRPASSP